jgi:hypothetical protein
MQKINHKPQLITFTLIALSLTALTIYSSHTQADSVTPSSTLTLTTTVNRYHLGDGGSITVGNSTQPLVINADTSAIGMVSSDALTIASSTTHDLGYNLMISSLPGDEKLKLTSDSTHYFDSVGGTSPKFGSIQTPTRLSPGTWGFAVPSSQTGTLRTGFNTAYPSSSNRDGSLEISVWSKISPTTKLIKRTASANSPDTPDQTSVYFGLRTAPTTQEGTYKSTVQFTATPNYPIYSSDFLVEIDQSLIPIYYDGTTMKIADRTNKNNTWYNYDDKRWANAVTVKPEKLATYKAASVNDTISSDDIIGYFVYIPRFKYQLQTLISANRPAAPVSFEISFENLLSIGYEKSPATDLTAVGQWLTHPAFTLGNTELAGFWYGKFVASGTESTGTTGTMIKTVPTSSPFTTSASALWRNITDNHPLSFRTPHNITASTDSHLQRNSEYSAVAYLTNSKYGRLTTEPTSGPGNDYISNGAKSSTSNITGVYDLVGVSQLVMGNLNNTLASSGFTALPDAKYTDTFSIPTINDCAKSCLGQDLSEVAGWRSATASWVTSSSPWIIRGGNSIFSYNTSDGSSVASRIVLTRGDLWAGYCKDSNYAPSLCAPLTPTP